MIITLLLLLTILFLSIESQKYLKIPSPITLIELSYIDMNCIKRFLLLILIASSWLFANEEFVPQKHKIIFDADGDKRADTIEYVVTKSDMRNATVQIKISPTNAKPLNFSVGSYVNYIIEPCKEPLCIKIFNADYGIWAETITSYYHYDRLKRSWFLKNLLLRCLLPISSVISYQ